MSVLSRINELVKSNSQFIITTHSPIIMAYPEADIYEVSEKGITKVEYENTNHYQVSKFFLNNTEMMLKELLY